MILKEVQRIMLSEKAKSRAQQRFFGMVRAAQKGEMDNPSSEVLDAADSMKVDDVKKFAKTKHKGLPEKKEVKEEPERTAAYKAMQASLHPRGSTVDAKQGETATAHRVGGWRNPKNRGKKRKVMAEFEPELEMVEAVKGQDTLSRKQGAKERATEKKAHDEWKKSGVGKTKRPLYSTTRHTKGDAESYATQQKQSIKWHHKRTKGKYFPGEQPIGEELVSERLGGKGYKPYTSMTGKKVSGDWEDSDRGAGNKAKKRAGGTVKKKSPTYQAYVLNKEETRNGVTLAKGKFGSTLSYGGALGKESQIAKGKRLGFSGDLKTDAERYRVPRGPGGNPKRLGDKVRSMNDNQPLGKLKVKYGADTVSYTHLRAHET